MQNILARFKSPVLLGQIIVTVVGVLVYFMPGQAEAIQIVSAAIVALVNLVAGLNDPTNKHAF